MSGTHTANGKPIVANDPHLTLMAPPVWYEMNLSQGDTRVRGVTFPGVPFVVIGENHAGAWGFTNAGADVIDFYRYETDGDRYRYKGEWRDFDTEQREIEVADGKNRTTTVKKTVHGPVLERDGYRVGVAWTGHTATETTLAIHEYSTSNGVDDLRAATKRFDEPTQNLVYADRDGNTLYYTTGRIPRRTVNGKRVRGDRIFDGSAGEAEWTGFEPFGVSTWEGFVPFDEKPHVTNPDLIATANQRITEDPYLSEAYASPYRAQRIYELLDEKAKSGNIDVTTMEGIQDDTLDKRAESLVPTLVEAATRERRNSNRPSRRCRTGTIGWNATRGRPCCSSAGSTRSARRRSPIRSRRPGWTKDITHAIGCWHISTEVGGSEATDERRRWSERSSEQ